MCIMWGSAVEETLSVLQISISRPNQWRLDTSSSVVGWRLRSSDPGFFLSIKNYSVRIEFYPQESLTVNKSRLDQFHQRERKDLGVIMMLSFTPRTGIEFDEARQGEPTRG